MIWTVTDHMKMEAIKDPRVDDKKEAEPEDTSKAVQDNLDFKPEGGKNEE
jgi:hypothetical protein